MKIQKIPWPASTMEVAGLAEEYSAQARFVIPNAAKPMLGLSLLIMIIPLKFKFKFLYSISYDKKKEIS